jgi:hypothetical protein
MAHLRVGVGLGCLGLAAHTAYVHRERQLAPSGRALLFTPGSQDDLQSDRLRTGDLLLFSRDCLLYGACGALACGARRALPGGDATYDHVAVVVLHRGAPHVLEATHSGPALRPLPARIRCSRAREILVRPLQPPLTPQQAAAAAAAVAAALAPQSPEAAAAASAREAPAASMARSLASARGAASALGEVAATALGAPRANASVAAAARFYERVLGSAADAAAAQPAASDLERLGALPISRTTSAAGTSHTFGRAYFFRDLQ